MPDSLSDTPVCPIRHRRWLADKCSRCIHKSYRCGPSCDTRSSPHHSKPLCLVLLHIYTAFTHYLYSVSILSTQLLHFIHIDFPHYIYSFPTLSIPLLHFTSFREAWRLVTPHPANTHPRHGRRLFSHAADELFPTVNVTSSYAKSSQAGRGQWSPTSSARSTESQDSP